MIRRVSSQFSRRREAFTLLEVLVVVAILVILGSVAGISYFRYIEDAKVDTSKQSAKTIEQACRAYMIKNANTPPNDLNVLVDVTNGRPYLEGGPSAINDAWGRPFQYNASNTNQAGDPDPVVFFTNPATNQPEYAVGRK
jgi:general secretion pathway protein G